MFKINSPPKVVPGYSWIWLLIVKEYQIFRWTQVLEHVTDVVCFVTPGVSYYIDYPNNK